MRRIATLSVACLVMAACAQAGSPEPGEGTITSSPPVTTSTTSVGTSQPPGGSDTDVLLVAAVDDLLGRVDATRDQVELVSFESGQWSDGSIGCPEDGFSYTQALVDGYRIKLMVNGTVYVYAQGGDQPIFYCEQPNEDAFHTDFTLPEPSIPPPID